MDEKQAAASEQNTGTESGESGVLFDLGLSGEVGKFMNLVTAHLMSHGFISYDDTRSMEPIFEGTKVTASDKEIVSKRVCDKVADVFLAAYAEHCCLRNEISQNQEGEQKTDTEQFPPIARCSGPTDAEQTEFQHRLDNAIREGLSPEAISAWERHRESQ